MYYVVFYAVHSTEMLRLKEALDRDETGMVFNVNTTTTTTTTTTVCGRASKCRNLGRCGGPVTCGAG